MPTKTQLHAIIPPDRMAEIITDISNALDIEPPDDERQIRFFEVQLVNTVKSHRKSAEEYERLRGPLKVAIYGR